MARPSDRINSALNKHGYTQVKKIGEGSFGAAILVQHEKERDKDVKAIVKMIDISRATKAEKEDALKESKVLSSLKHPYIVRYRESFHEDGWLCIVMDYCEGGDLSDRVKKMRQSGKSFPEEQVVRWFTQSILALKYIHDLHILHRDLKSGNFFLSKSGNIKMGDFGIAKVLECTAACAQTQIGTPYYLSPEICQGKPYAWGSDIWSMGCILYEMCAKRVPFDAPDLKNLIKRITQGPTPDVPAEYSSALRTLCKDLLDRDPNRRPQAAEILKRPVIQDMVRRMLDEVRGDEESAAPAGSEAPTRASGGGAPVRVAASSGGKYTDTAGTYSKNQSVEYYSETHGEWLPATVTSVDGDGRIMLNVKPNVWLSLEVQAAKVRTGGDGQAPSVGRTPSSAGPSARPSVQPGPGSPNRPPPPTAQHRPPSDRRDMVRNSSRDRVEVSRAGGAPAAGGAMRRGPSQDRLQQRGAAPGAKAAALPPRGPGRGSAAG